MQSGDLEKLNKSILFPEILDMAPYINGTSEKSSLYSLYAVVVHLDIMNAAFSGHYVCYVKNNNGEWFRIDDSTVSSLCTSKQFYKYYQVGFLALFYTLRVLSFCYLAQKNK